MLLTQTREENHKKELKKQIYIQFYFCIVRSLFSHLTIGPKHLSFCQFLSLFHACYCQDSGGGRILAFSLKHLLCILISPVFYELCKINLLYCLLNTCHFELSISQLNSLVVNLIVSISFCAIYLLGDCSCVPLYLLNCNLFDFDTDFSDNVSLFCNKAGALLRGIFM